MCDQNMKSLFYLPFLVLLLATIAAGVSRQLILYESETRNEKFYTFTSAVKNARVFPWMRNIRRICYLGRWHCYKDRDFHHVSPVTRHIFTQFSETTFTCRNLSSTQESGSSLYNNELWTGFAGFCGSFRPAGGGLDMSVTTLTLFDDAYFSGRELTLNSEMQGIRTFPPGFTVNSLSWTGGRSGWSNWTIFEQPEFRGFSDCLSKQGSDYSAKPAWGTTVKSVGSIVHGCDPADSSLLSLDRNTWPKIQRRFTDTVDTVSRMAMFNMGLFTMGFA